MSGGRSPALGEDVKRYPEDRDHKENPRSDQPSLHNESPLLGKDYITQPAIQLPAWQDVERFALSSTEGFEATAVQGDNLVSANLVAQKHEGRIRQIHRSIGVLLDKGGGQKELLRLSTFGYVHADGLNKFRQVPRTITVVLQEMHGLRDNRTRRAERSCEIVDYC